MARINTELLNESAENLLSEFPDVDYTELLRSITRQYFFRLYHGTKTEKNAAGDFMAMLKVFAFKLQNSK